MQTYKCRLKEEGLSAGSCMVEVQGTRHLACRATLRYEDDGVNRLITSVHLSRPENYLSIYQSGCNLSCRKCHSWHFSKVKDGTWYAPGDILKETLAYDKLVTLEEPRSKATAWHAHDSCRCCGGCVVQGHRSPSCPGVLEPESIFYESPGIRPGA